MRKTNGIISKSANATKYSKNKFKKDEILVVVPTNSMAKRFMAEYQLNAVTYHRFKGEDIHEDSTAKAYDINGIKCILFDEILLLKHSQLIKVSKFMDAHPDIEFLATCGAEQLPAINDPVDVDMKLRYLMSPRLFPNVIQLKINKRVDPGDRERLEAVLHDLLEAKHSGKQALINVIQKHFKDQMVTDLDDMKTKSITKALSYYTESRDLLNKHINTYYQHSKHNYKHIVLSEDGSRYYYGQKLVVRDSILSKEGVKLHPNYEYTIKEMNQKQFTLEDVLDGKTITIEKKQVDKHFAFSFCNTVHSSQGDSINQAYVIADWKGKWSCDKWLYTAITRTRSLKNVWFLEENLLSAVDSRKRMHELISGYKDQDKKAKRVYREEDYITVDWGMEQLDHNGIWCVASVG
jgi:ATP-dependent exoDNAse (exonuclease V) alpha subunit